MTAPPRRRSQTKILSLRFMLKLYACGAAAVNGGRIGLALVTVLLAGTQTAQVRV